MKYRVLTIVVLLFAAGCTAGTVADTPAAGSGPAVETPLAEPSPTPDTAPPAEVLPADPQDIVFQASDGWDLRGRYYPAAVNPAPVVVFMHWVRGDMNDWNEIAPWLQNRGLKNPYPNCVEDPSASNQQWLDPSWFPPLPAELSYAVFLVTFRNHKPCQGASPFAPDEWLLDAQAAIQKASQLDGVDPKRIAAIGSSIGADGAADACFWLNQQTPDSCRGALSLSPGGFLGVAYPDAVRALGMEKTPKPAWCLADLNEIGMCEMVHEADNPKYRMFEIQNGGHGNLLIVPDAKPSTLQTILDFLDETLG
jgi:hypothetical protein